MIFGHIISSAELPNLKLHGQSDDLKPKLIRGGLEFELSQWEMGREFRLVSPSAGLMVEHLSLDRIVHLAISEDCPHNFAGLAHP